MRQAAIGFVRKKLNLEGILTTPQELPQPYPGLVLCHPHPLLGGNMDAPVIVEICRAADARGIATFRFNFHGVGGSDGKFKEDSDAQQDLKSALNVLRKWPGVDKKRVAVLGYSYGASVVLTGLKHFKSASSLALIAPPLASVAESRIFADKRPKLFIVGQQDRIVESVKLQGLLDDVRPPLQFKEIPGADHTLRSHEQQVAEYTAAFLAETLFDLR